MPRYKLIAISRPAAGTDEQEYNRWYNDQHLPDVCAVPGIISAQRFVATSKQPNIGARMAEYCAIYEIDTDDLDLVMRELEQRAGTDAMPISDTLDVSSTGAMIYEVIPG